MSGFFLNWESFRKICHKLGPGGSFLDGFLMRKRNKRGRRTSNATTNILYVDLRFNNKFEIITTQTNYTVNFDLVTCICNIIRLYIYIFTDVISSKQKLNKDSKWFLLEELTAACLYWSSYKFIINFSSNLFFLFFIIIILFDQFPIIGGISLVRLLCKFGAQHIHTWID